jgi:hypothetical protein
VAAFFAAAFAVLSLALLDLVGGLLPAGAEATTSHSVADVGFGVLGVVLIGTAFGSLARRTSDHAAALSQVGLVVVALVVTAAWTADAVGLVGAVAVLLPLTLVWALHPDRRDALGHVSWTLGKRWQLACAVVLVVLLVVHANAVAAQGRDGALPSDSFAFVPSFSGAVVAALVATGLVALSAATREGSWTLSTLSVAAAVLLMGLASAVNPQAPASAGRGWGVAAFAWVVAWLVAGRQVRSRPR